MPELDRGHSGKPCTEKVGCSCCVILQSAEHAEILESIHLGEFHVCVVS